MAYRFTDTLKWQDEWFVDLKSNEKLLFMYLCDCCDIAGFVEMSYRKFSFDLGLTETEIKGALKGLNKGVFISDDNRCLLVKNFIKHQKNMPLNPENKSHIGILKRVSIYIDKFNNVALDYQKGYLGKGALEPLERGTGIGIGNSIISINIEERISNFKNAIYPFVKTKNNLDGLADATTLKEFFEYWQEPNKSKTKMRWEMEKTWDLKLRILRWAGNSFSTKNKSPEKITTHIEPKKPINHAERE